MNGFAHEVRIVRLAPFLAVTSGQDRPEKIFGDFNDWQEAHAHLIRPMLYGAPDFLSGAEDGMEWLWAVKDGVTDADVQPYRLTDFPGGLYACAVTTDGDDEAMGRTHAGMLTWLDGTGFAPDEERRTLMHMLEPEKDVRDALGYDQAEIFVPIRLKE